MAQTGKMGAWRTAVIGLILLVFWTVRPIGVDAPRHVDARFDADRAIARLANILGDQRPHPTDSDANDAVEARLLAAIRQAGFQPTIDERFHCNNVREGAAICARPRNIAFWITPPGDNAVMIAAHYDSVPTGPGAADDGIGVAVALELARMLKGKALGRPVLVLLTDAEEAGLVGAAAFAAHDPLRKRIGAVVNMEARGTTGGVNMFQTSSPNARDVAAIGGKPLPFANALAADFYALLPNDTDLTMLLPLGIDAGNYSVIGGGKRYHTPLDDLAHLDRNSVRHMGVTTLAAVEAFAAEGKPQSAEGQRIYTDLGRTILLDMPKSAGLAALLAGVAAALVLFLRAGPDRRVRGALIPLLALVAGTALAVGASALVAALRSEADYGTAYPVIFRLLYGAAALTGATLVLALLGEKHGARTAAAGWFWLGVPILALFAMVPGLSILAIWPMLLVVVAAVIRPAANYLLIAAAILFALIALPLAGGLEEGLFVEHSAPSALLLVFALLFCMPGGAIRARWAAALFGTIAVVAFAGSLAVPAFTRDAPRHLNVVHEDVDGKAAFLVWNNGPLPGAMRAAAAFATQPDDKGDWRAPAPRLEDDGRIDITAAAGAGNRRVFRLFAMAPQADRQELLIEKGEGIHALTVNGTQPAVKGVPTYIGCTGRSCRTLSVELVLDAGARLPEIVWRRTRYGAGVAGGRLTALRPASAQPVHAGDRRVWRRTLNLPPVAGQTR